MLESEVDRQTEWRKSERDDRKPAESRSCDCCPCLIIADIGRTEYSQALIRVHSVHLMKDVIDSACGRMELRQIFRTDAVLLRLFQQVVEKIAEIQERLQIFAGDLHLCLLHSNRIVSHPSKRPVQ